MREHIVFDCYQTLIYKKNIVNIVQVFSRNILKKKIPSYYIKHGYNIIYDRYKFKRPRFETPQKRKEFYIGYNIELFNIIGITVSTYQALQLSKYLEDALWVCYPDTLIALKYFKKIEVPMGLLANWTKTLDKVLKDVNLTSYFDFVYSSYNLKLDKPNPKIFTKTLGNVISKFDKVYYVGNDYELDIAPAKKAGLIPVLIDRDNRYPDSVDCIRIKKLTDLGKIINL